MIVSLIVAVAENRVIGKDNDLIWSLPEDMKHFKRTTAGKLIITGRKNYESIPAKFRPLPNRVNYVLTRNSAYNADGCELFSSLKDALSAAKETGLEEIFIIGGGQIYKEAITENLVDRMYITHVRSAFEGDTFFPEVNWSNWEEHSSEDFSADEKHAVPYTISTYYKK